MRYRKEILVELSDFAFIIGLLWYGISEIFLEIIEILLWPVFYLFG